MRKTDKRTDNGERPTYTTRRGRVLTLKPISSVIIYQMQSDVIGKPQPPIVTMEVGKKKQKVKEANPNDPDYKARLNKWESERNTRFIRYVFDRGVEDEPTEAEYAELRDYNPNQTRSALKFIWALEQLDGDDEMGELVQAVMGLTVPTAGGVAEAEATFPGDSERDQHTAVSTAQSPAND